MKEYNESCVVVTANNSEMSITHIGKAIVIPHFNSSEVELKKCAKCARNEKKKVSSQYHS